MKFIIILFSLILQACGMQGDLYLPKENESHKSAVESELLDEKTQTVDVLTKLTKRA